MVTMTYYDESTKFTEAEFELVRAWANSSNLMKYKLIAHEKAKELGLKKYSIEWVNYDMNVNIRNNDTGEIKKFRLASLGKLEEVKA